ncbi:MAG: hypothetical protein F9K29_19290 [Hyphomicrobiaceae bacterium]|nr:MAG: hypothetical protein F9K29_19290 [Hyphomicrobiaceae bacterium]
MGMETLNNAARAAGFAMAGSDDQFDERKVEAKPEERGWRPGEAVLLHAPPKKDQAKAHTSMTEWIKGMFGVSGRGAPA